MIKKKRDLMKEARDKKYVAMYQDFLLGLDWQELATKYDYKNEKSVRATFYQSIIPVLNNLLKTHEK